KRTLRAPTALAFVALDKHGERSFRFYRPPAADLLYKPADFDDAILALALARAAGALVSFDANLRPALWGVGVDPAPRLWRTLAGADLVKLSAEEHAFLAARAKGEAAVLE